MISKNIKPSIWVEQVTSKIEHVGNLIDIACGEGFFMKNMQKTFLKTNPKQLCLLPKCLLIYLLVN